MRVPITQLELGDTVRICGVDRIVTARYPSHSPGTTIIAFDDDDVHPVYDTAVYEVIDRPNRPLTASEAEFMFAAIDEARAIEAGQ